MWNNRYILIIVGLITLYSCGSKRKVATAPNNGKVESPIASNYAINNVNVGTFSGRAKTKVEFDGQKHDATLNIRIRNDQAIWISVTATIFNYEAARVLITPDSIKIMNKLQSEYIAKPFSYVSRYTGAGVSFSMLQDLLMANVSGQLLRTDQMTVASAGEDVQLVGVKDNLSFQYSLNGEYRPKVFRLTAVGADGILEAFYGGFNKATGYNYPQNQNLKLNTSSFKVNALLDYNKLEFNQPVEIPFNVPSKYREVK